MEGEEGVREGVSEYVREWVREEHECSREE
jgi:hypothetical protein